MSFEGVHVLEAENFLEHIGNFPLGTDTELEVSSEPVIDGGSATSLEPSFYIVNKKTNQKLDVRSLLPEGGNFSWGNQWGSMIGDIPEVTIPPFDKEGVGEIKGKEVLFALFHEIGHAHRDSDIYKKLLKRARLRVFTTKAAEIYGKDSIEYENALHVEFKITVGGERTAWAHALKELRRVNESFGGGVIDDLSKDEIEQLVHSKQALGSYMISYTKQLEDLGTFSEEDLERMMHNTNTDTALTEKFSVINRLFDCDLEYYGVDLNKFVFHIDKVDTAKVETILDEFDEFIKRTPNWMESHEIWTYAKALKDIVPN